MHDVVSFFFFFLFRSELGFFDVLGELLVVVVSVLVTGCGRRLWMSEWQIRRLDLESSSYRY
jgi:hypothetical protein